MSNSIKKLEVVPDPIKESPAMKLRAVEDVFQKGSRESGIKGLFEKVLREFRIITHALALIPLYVGASICFGVSLQPSIHFFQWVNHASYDVNYVIRYLCLGIGLAVGFY